MAQPPRYERKKDFASDYGSDTDHTALNAELDGVAQSINATRENLALMQRDDGALRNGIVTVDSLSEGLLGDITHIVGGAIDDKVQQATVAASEAVNAAINSANSATNSQTYAEQSLVAAGTAQANAQASNASKVAAAASESAASASAASALSSKAAAETAASSAMLSESQAAQSAMDAADSAASIEGSVDAAAASAADALTSKSEAANSEALAKAWANKEDGPVADGLFSAKHYADLASQYAGLRVFQSPPAADVGPVYVVSYGPMEWDQPGSEYKQVAPPEHTHKIADVTGLQAALDGKQPKGDYQPAGNYQPALGYAPVNKAGDMGLGSMRMVAGGDIHSSSWGGWLSAALNSKTSTAGLPEVLANLPTGGVGTLGLMMPDSTAGQTGPGATASGAHLRWSSAAGQDWGTPAGTWRCLGGSSGVFNQSTSVTLWQRIA